MTSGPFAANLKPSAPLGSAAIVPDAPDRERSTLIRPAATLHLSPAQWALLLALSLLWGCAFYFGQVALAELPPFSIVFLRVAAAAAVLGGLVAASGQKFAVTWSACRAFLTLGVLNCLLPFALLLSAQARIGSGLVSVLAATTPLFTTLVAHYMLRDEKMTRALIVGILLGVGGMMLATAPRAPQSFADLSACLAVLAASLCYALANVLGRRLENVPPLPLATGQLAAASLLALPIALVVERPWTLTSPSFQCWVAIVMLALFSTALGYVLFFRLLAQVGAVNTSLVSLLVPMTALLLAGAILQEPLDWSVFAGAGLIFVGLGWVNRSSKS